MKTKACVKLSLFLIYWALVGCSGMQNASQLATSAERPGLGTSFGETRSSKTSSAEFQRDNPLRPWVLAAIRYNDLEGVAAEGVGYTRPFADLNDLVRFSVRSSDGQAYPIARRFRFFGKPDYLVIGKAGERYELEIKNNSDTCLEVVASVDGLDVLNGQSAFVGKRGYLLKPGKTLVIDGWRTSANSVSAFRFGSVNNSYAAKKTADTRNVGVIGLAIFNAYRSQPRPFLENEIRLRKKADPFPGGSGFAEPPPR